MKIEELIRLLQFRLASLNTARASAVSVGDIAQINIIDADVLQTQATLDQLLTLI